MLSILLIVFLVLAFISAIRIRVYSTGGYPPNRALGLVVVMLVVMAFADGFIDL